MLRVFAAVLALLGLCAGCGNGIKSKEKVQAAILDRLQTRTGLNMGDLMVDTTAVSFDKNLAFATVAIHPKGDSNIQHGMSMKYTLEERDGKWVVMNAGSPGLGGRTNGGGEGAAPHSGSLPAGHPPVTKPEGSAR